MDFDNSGDLGFDDVEASASQAPRVAPSHASLLQRIADTIGVTVDLFHDDTLLPAGRSPATTAEVHALLDAFLALRGPDARRRCISLASAEVASGQ